MTAGQQQDFINQNTTPGCYRNLSIFSSTTIDKLSAQNQIKSVFEINHLLEVASLFNSHSGIINSVDVRD